MREIKEFERHRGGERASERERERELRREFLCGVVDLGDLVSVVTSRTG